MAFQDISGVGINYFWVQRYYRSKGELKVDEVKHGIKQVILSEPTWVEYDSLRAQLDMRERCAEAAEKYWDNAVAGIEKQADTIAKLEKENRYLRAWMVATTGMSAEDVKDVVAEVDNSTYQQ